MKNCEWVWFVGTRTMAKVPIVEVMAALVIADYYLIARTNKM
ncbi:MAG: hypothetical protein ABJ004_13735 [Cyclobacteriaceae bacterium]